MPEGYTLTDGPKDLSYGMPEGYTLTDGPKDLSYGMPEGYTFLNYNSLISIT